MKKGRKLTGGRYRKGQRKKKSFERAGETKVVNLGERKIKKIRTRGGSKKLVLLSENQANLIHKNKAQKAEITNVIETPSNRFLARQNILIKGAIIETNKGKAKITNRPSQESSIQAILVE